MSMTQAARRIVTPTRRALITPIRKDITNPTAGDVHVNTALTNFSQKFLQDEQSFVSLRAMPNLPVAKQSDLYYVFDRNSFLRDESQERADGAESAGGGFTLSTNPYFARVYAFHKDVTDRQRANADSVINLEQSATQFVQQKNMIRRERSFAAAYMALSIWNTNFTGVAAAPGATEFIFWDAAASDPIANVRLAKRTIQQNTGIRPNKMIIGREAYDTLCENDAILARIVGGSTTEMPAMVLRKLIAQLFELDEIFVMDGVFNSSLRGAATQTVSFIGGDNALVYYAPDSIGPDTVTAGVQFSWTGLFGSSQNGQRTKRFRMEHLESDRIESEMSFDYRVSAPELGFFFSNCTT